MPPIIFLLLWSLYPVVPSAQVITFVAVDSAAVTVLDNYPNATHSLSDTSEVMPFLQELIYQLHLDGRWAASVDSIKWKDQQAVVHLFVGPIYQIRQLEFDSLSRHRLSVIGFPLVRNLSRRHSVESIKTLQEAILSHAENNGYPFAKVSAQPADWNNRHTSIELGVQLGPMIVYAPIEVIGNAQISSHYLMQYLGIVEGRPYNEKQLAKAQEHLAQLPFVKINRAPVVSFKENRAVLNVFVDKKAASNFDFVLGLLPQAQNAGDPSANSKVLLSGTVRAELYNAIGQGEQLQFHYEQLPPNTQELVLETHYPYPFQLPIGVDAGIALYRRDTTYVDLIAHIGSRYLLPGGNYVRIFWQTNSSNVLSMDTLAVIRSRKLPEVLDIREHTFGIASLWQQLDYRYNPRKGWRIQVSISAGTKSIKPNRLITELENGADGFSFAELYDSVSARSPQYRVLGSVSHFVPMFQRSTLQLRLQGGWIYSEQAFSRNEQYRIGGHRLLRGFDEEQIFANFYVVSTLEYRQLIAKQSYLFAFWDGAYIESNTRSTSFADRPFGWGAGMTFDTQAGIFALSIAWGRQQQQPVDWASPRFHFGYLNRF